MLLKLDVFLVEKIVWTIKKTFLLLNNVISTLDFVKILTYYIDDKKIFENSNRI